MPPSKDGPLRVLAVVHNRILREGICCLVETQDDLDLVGAVASAEAAVFDSYQDVFHFLYSLGRSERRQSESCP